MERPSLHVGGRALRLRLAVGLLVSDAPGAGLSHETTIPSASLTYASTLKTISSPHLYPTEFSLSVRPFRSTSSHEFANAEIADIAAADTKRIFLMP